MSATSTQSELVASPNSSGLYVGIGGPRCSCLGEIPGGDSNSDPDLECVKCGGSGLVTWWWGATEASAFEQMGLKALATFVRLRTIGMKKSDHNKESMSIQEPVPDSYPIINMTTLWPGIAAGATLFFFPFN